MTQPSIKTERLVLRPFRLDDSESVESMASDKKIAEGMLDMPHPYPKGAAEEWIGTHKAQFDTLSAARFAITLNSDLIGSVGLNIFR